DTAPLEKISFSASSLSRLSCVLRWGLRIEADGNLFRFGFLGLRQGDDQQTVFIVGPHLLVLHVAWERHGAHKLTRSPFTAVKGFGLNLGGQALFLTRHGQAIVLHSELDGRWLKARGQGSDIQRVRV